MYAGDLARVIKYIIENNIKGNFNVAPNYVHSIEEITKIGLKACSKEDLKINYNNTKPDGQYRKDVDSSKLMSVLKDFEFTSLEEGIREFMITLVKDTIDNNDIDNLIDWLKTSRLTKVITLELESKYSDWLSENIQYFVIQAHPPIF